MTASFTAWTSKAVSVAVLAALLSLEAGTAAGQEASSFAGRWAIDRQASQFPAEIGFDADFAPSGGGAQQGGRAPGAPAAIFPSRESPDDAQRKQNLTAEVRTPSAYLLINVTPTAVTIGDDRAVSRTFHPTGRDDVIQLGAVPVTVNARWDGGRLVIRYKVEEGRELQYTYALNAAPRQLVVDVKFVERGGGDAVHRVYDALGADEMLPAPSAVVTAAASRGVPGRTPSPTGPPAPAPAPAPTTDAAPAAPALGSLAADAELRGLTEMGLVVEELSAQATECGLDRGVIETAVNKTLTDAGFKVRRNSDEDTYLYVNVMTTTLPSGYCVSRYDAYLYSSVIAKLAYQPTATLMQVSLLHTAGIAGSTRAGHGDGVVRGIVGYVGQFVTRIKAANK